MMAAVDSGTTTLVFDEAIYELLRSYFQSHYCDVPGLCPTSGSNTTWFSSVSTTTCVTLPFSHMLYIVEFLRYFGQTTAG